MTEETPTDAGQTEDPPWPLWAADFQPKVKREHLPPFGKWMQKHAPQLWSGQEGFSFQGNDHDRLRTKLQETAQGAGAEVLLTSWWDRMVHAGNYHKRWAIELLPPVVRLPESRPTFVRRDFQLLKQFRTTESQFVGRVVAGLPSTLLEDALLCSAVIFGGIVSLPFLEGLLNSEHCSLSNYKGHLSLTLQIPDGKKNPPRPLRWYPDPLTGVLLTRVMKNKASNDPELLLPELLGTLHSKGPLERLAAAIERLRLPASGDNRMELLRAARVAMALYAPGYVIAYLAGEVTSWTLPDDIHKRVCGWHQGEMPSSEEEVTRKAPVGLESPENRFDERQVPADQLRVIRAATAILREGVDPIAKLRDLASSHAGQLWPVTSYLLSWARWLLGETSSRKGVRPSSAERYLKTVARHLIDIVDTEDLLTLESEDFETCYELAAEKVKGNKERGYFWAQVRSLHDYLWLCGAPQVDLGELDGFATSETGRVSANIITEFEFEIFKRALAPKDGAPMPETKEWVLLVAVLGFRAGLRRREIQMLGLSDIHPGPDPYLIVKPSKLATLKSASSRRRIPLQPLLQQDELKLLRDFSERRRKLLGDQEGLLFAYAQNPRVPLPQTVLFDPVTQIFQQITAPSSVIFRFHHLRHSFANWLFLRLVAMDQPTLIDPDYPLFDTYMQEPKRVCALGKYFFPRLMGTPIPPGRRHLYLVSALLGHLSPITTLKSYIHLMDWISGHEVETAMKQRLPVLGPGELGAICGLSASMPFKHPYKDLTTQPASFFRRFIQSRLPTRYDEALGKLPRSYDFTQAMERLGKTIIPHPLSLMVALARYLAGASLQYVEKLHSIPGDAMRQARLAYIQMFAKHFANAPEKRVRLPTPPTVLRDCGEFWRILETTYASYEKPENRPMMLLAAEALIRRTGSNSGHVYFGKRLEDAPKVIRGLLSMGISQNDIKIVKRVHGVLNPSLHSLLITLENMGLTIEEEVLEWKDRKMANTLLRLDINVFRSSPPYTHSRWKGRIKGINFAAMWLRFADQYCRYHEPATSVLDGFDGVEMHQQTINS